MLSLDSASALSQHSGKAMFYCSSLKEKKKTIKGLTITDPDYMKLINSMINYHLHE